MFEPPLDLPGSLWTLGRWGDDGLDRWDGALLVRTIRELGRVIAYTARSVGSVDRPILEVTASVADRDLVVSVVQSSFVTAPVALRELAGRDPVIERVEVTHPGIRPVIHRDPLTALIRSISAQQVNLRWASEIRKRLGERYGTRMEVAGDWVIALDPARLAAATIDELRVLQLTTAKSRSVIAVAEAVVEGRLEREELASLDDAALTERLVALPGIGPWSADWYLARTLGRPRVVAGDLGVRKAVGRAYLSGRMPSEAEVRTLTAHWGEAAGVAQQLLLHDLTVALG